MSKQSAFNIVPTAEERKERQNELKGKALVIHTDDTLKTLKKLKMMGTSDVAFSMIHDVMMLSVFNDKEMNQQMLLWKDLAKKGKLEVLECNNITRTIHGKEYYFMTVNPIGQNANFDPIGLAIGFLVNGYIYGFRREVNRDAVFNYIKKQMKKEKKEEKEEKE
jgi:hypothetical protein